MALDEGRHPDAEQLAEYADGVLGANVRAKVEEHLVNCPDCRAVLMETMAVAAVGRNESQTIGAEPGSGALSRRWVAGAVGLAAAAVLVLIVRLARPDLLDRVFGPRSVRPEVQELIAAMANEPTRPIEGRLSVAFKYAPAPSPTRGPGDREVSAEVRIAAAKIEELARADAAPERLAALGVAYLAVGDLELGIMSLEDAAAARPSDPSILNDLAAAYLSRARRGARADDLSMAASAADRAIRAAPLMLEPRFNRALAFDLLGPPSAAAAAWDEYLRIHSRSPWAEEARRHVRALRLEPRVSFSRWTSGARVPADASVEEAMEQLARTSP